MKAYQFAIVTSVQFATMMMVAATQVSLPHVNWAHLMDVSAWAAVVLFGIGGVSLWYEFLGRPTIEDVRNRFRGEA